VRGLIGAVVGVVVGAVRGGGGVGVVTTDAWGVTRGTGGVVTGPGVVGTGVGVGAGVGAGFGAAWVAWVFPDSGATWVEGSGFGGSLAHPTRARDAAVSATAMLPDVEMAVRAQNGHDVSDA
jgi:hypothetical protein